MRGDKMGPENRGPKTGRGLGYCNGNDKPGYESNEAPQGMRRGGGSGFGRGARGGFGRGRGFGRGYGMSMDQSPVDMNGNQSKDILDRLEKIEQKFNTLEKK